MKLTKLPFFSLSSLQVIDPQPFQPLPNTHHHSPPPPPPPPPPPQPLQSQPQIQPLEKKCKSDATTYIDCFFRLFFWVPHFQSESGKSSYLLTRWIIPETKIKAIKTVTTTLTTMTVTMTTTMKTRSPFSQTENDKSENMYGGRIYAGLPYEQNGQLPRAPRSR